MQNTPTFLTITRAAEFLKVSPDTLRRWEAKGIVTPQRTPGGSRRYTLYDLKIAKLNKSKKNLFHLPTLLTHNYINSKQDLKIALITSFLWIFALLAFHFLTPIFLRPANPEQQVFLNQSKESPRLKIASETAPVKVNIIKVLVIPDSTQTTAGLTPKAVSQGSDLLIRRVDGLPSLKYVETVDQYYSLQPLPQNQIPTLIKRI